MLKILVADDHPIVREGLKLIIAKMPDMKVTGEASDGQELIDRLRSDQPDVVLLDISMPGRSGLEVLKQIKTRWPKIRLLVLSHHPEDQYALRVLRAGAAGYLTKESASEQLITAIRKVAIGGKYVSPALAERLAAELEGPGDRPPHGTLSDREYEVLCKIGGGESVSEIADELSLSVKTISTYRARILSKMNMNKTAEIIHYAIRYGLVDSGPSTSKSVSKRATRETL